MKTVTGTIKNPDGTTYIGPIQFTPQSTPVATGGYLVRTAGVTARTLGNGTFSVNLEPGDYLVTIATGVKLTISVDDEDGEADLLDLIVTDLVYAPEHPSTTPLEGSNFRFKRRNDAWVFQLLNTSSGLYHDAQCRNVDTIPVITPSDVGEE